MTEFESAVWERYHIEQQKGKGINLRNRSMPRDKEGAPLKSTSGIFKTIQKSTLVNIFKKIIIMTLPQELLSNVYWAFYERFDTQEDFQAALLEYNDPVFRKLPPLDSIALPAQKVVIQYLWIPMMDEDDSEEDEEDRQFIIETDQSCRLYRGRDHVQNQSGSLHSTLW